MSYARVVVTLKEHHFEEISEAEWKLWVNYYLPLVETNPQDTLDINSFLLQGNFS